MSHPQTGPYTMTATETVAAKAGRLLTEGCLQIRSVDTEWITATIEGDTGAYRLGLNPGGWSCACPARTRRCSHLLALQTVTLTPTQPKQDRTGTTQPTREKQSQPTQTHPHPGE